MRASVLSTIDLGNDPIGFFPSFLFLRLEIRILGTTTTPAGNKFRVKSVRPFVQMYVHVCTTHSNQEATDPVEVESASLQLPACCDA